MDWPSGGAIRCACRVERQQTLATWIHKMIACGRSYRCAISTRFFSGNRRRKAHD